MYIHQFRQQGEVFGDSVVVHGVGLGNFGIGKLQIADCRWNEEKSFLPICNWQSAIANLQSFNSKKSPGINPGTFEYSAKKTISS
jgi:hypothetical protein